MKLHAKILLGLIVSLSLRIVNLTVGVDRWRLTVGVANPVVETVNSVRCRSAGPGVLRHLSREFGWL